MPPRTKCPNGRQCKHYDGKVMSGPEGDGCMGDCARGIKDPPADIEIPVVIGHDQREIIGYVRWKHGRVTATFIKEITRDQFFNIFDCGARILESRVENDQMMIRSAEIIHFNMGGSGDSGGTSEPEPCFYHPGYCINGICVTRCAREIEDERVAHDIPAFLRSPQADLDLDYDSGPEGEDGPWAHGWETRANDPEGRIAWLEERLGQLTTENFALAAGQCHISHGLIGDSQGNILCIMLEAIKKLVALKDHKDKYGRDDVYLAEQPAAWEHARNLINRGRL